MNKVHDFLSHVQSDVNRDFTFDTLDHSTIPSRNSVIEQDEEFNKIQTFVEEYKYLPFKSSIPVPLGEPVVLLESSLNGIDSVTDLINRKKSWENTRDKIILSNVRSRGNTQLVVKSRTSSAKGLSLGTLKLAEHLNVDPDVYFTGFYNWYYNDSCLNALSHDGNYSLISVRNNIPGTAVVTPLIIDKTDCNPVKNKIKFLETGYAQPILQTAVSDNFIALRQKHLTSLFKVKNGRKLAFKKIHQAKNEENAILCVDINDYKTDGEYCTISIGHTLKIWTPEVLNNCKAKVVLDVYCKKPCDHWGTVKYLSVNNIVTSSRSVVCLKDTRVNLHKTINNWDLHSSDMFCDNISVITKSNYENKIYVGTTHNLFELDVRKGLTKQWKHMLELPPLRGSVVNNINNEIETVFIGSQNINEICCVDSDLKTTPYILPSLNETLLKAKIHGHCLDPNAFIRFNLSTTGFTTIPFKNNNGSFVFRSNSVGDIFYQKLYVNDEMFTNSSEITVDDLRSLSLWEDDCNKATENLSNIPLKVTNVINNNTLFNNMKTPPKFKPKKSETFDKPWMKSKKELLNSNDPFSEYILDIWDIDDDEEWNVRNKKKLQVCEDERPDLNSRLNDWFTHLPTDPINVTQNKKDNILHDTDDRNSDSSYEPDSPIMTNRTSENLNFTVEPTSNVSQDCHDVRLQTEKKKLRFMEEPSGIKTALSSSCTLNDGLIKTTKGINSMSSQYSNVLNEDDEFIIGDSRPNYSKPNTLKRKASSTVTSSKSRFSSGF